MMAESDRPVRTVVDCQTGTVVHTPLTDEEIAADAALQARLADEEQARAAADAALRAAAAAHPDPLVRALAQRAGIL